jgi:hypothetical protein
MPTQTTKENVHEELLSNVLQRPLAEYDALLWMVLLHTHAIHLRSGVLSDGWTAGRNGENVVLPAITQRHAASVIAALWQRRDDERAKYVYWYRQFNTRTPYEVLDDVPEEMKADLVKLRALLAADPRVAAVVEED